MSYSVCGLYSHLLKESFYKLSWWSADLHFMYKASQEILKEKYTDKGKLKYIIIDIPYYIFNYDFSNNGLNYRKGLRFWEYFGDYNNLKEKSYYAAGIDQYKLYMDMFGEKKESNLYISDDITQMKVISPDEILRQKEGLSHIWKTLHEKTIIQNIEIFYAWLHQIKAYKPELKIIILVMPYSQYLEKFWPNELTATKTIFYDVMNKAKEKKLDVEVWDYFNVFYDDDNCFQDEMHLNHTGATKLSQIVNNRLLEIEKNE